MKRTPLKHRVSLRDSYRKKIKEQFCSRPIHFRKGNGRIERRSPLKKIAKSRRRQMAEYFALSTAFLLKPENGLCAICTVRREHGENILVQIATEIHHFAGRIGRLLCYVPFFKPSCRGCRSWPHDNPEKARAWGLLASPARWNVMPGN